MDLRNRKDPLRAVDSTGNNAWGQDPPAVYGSNTKGNNESSAPINMRLRAAYGHFAETTTFGGAIHTLVSPHRLWKGAWVVIVLVLIGATLWNTIQVIQDYLSFPVTTKVQVGHQASIPFPTVTVCNRNPIQCLTLALAYLKYPKELNNLMYYSNCKETLAVDPLLWRLVTEDAEEPGYKRWVAQLAVRTGSMIGSSSPAEFAAAFGFQKLSEAEACMLEVEGKPAVYNVTDADQNRLAGVLRKLNSPPCDATLEDFLFPTLVRPNSSSNAAQSLTAKAAKLVMAENSDAEAIPGLTPNLINGGKAMQEEDAATDDSATDVATDVATDDAATDDASIDELPGDEATTADDPATADEDGLVYDENNIPPDTFSPKVKEFLETEMFISEFSSIARNRSNLRLLKDLVNDFSGFIVNCTYFGVDCNDKANFSMDIVPEYGSCYTFNSAFEEDGGPNGTSGKRKSFLTGTMYGLSLEVVLNQDNYLPQLAAAGAGVRLTISPSGVRPNPADEGYYVKPHSEADFAFRLQTVSRQPDPYTSQCWSEWGPTPYQPLFFNIEKNKTLNIDAYSYAECQLACTSRLLVQHCKCVDPRKPQPFLFEGKEMGATTPVCNTAEKKDRDCRIGVLWKMQSNQDFQCECHLPCEEKQYITTVSTAEWPSQAYAQSLMEKYEHILEHLMSGDDISPNDKLEQRERLLSQEFAKINVYVQTMSVEQISEEPKYDISQLLSDLGGALGLYTGFCGVTLIEIAELLILLVAAMAGYHHSSGEEDHVGNRDQPMEDDQQIQRVLAANGMNRGSKVHAQESNANESDAWREPTASSTVQKQGTLHQEKKPDHEWDARMAPSPYDF